MIYTRKFSFYSKKDFQLKPDNLAYYICNMNEQLSAGQNDFISSVM